MFDIVTKKDSELINFAKQLGYSEIFTLSDFNVAVGGWEKNRAILTDKNVEILLNPHSGVKKDNLHFRQGGLNQVLCKLANKNNVTIAFSLDALRNKNDLGRAMANIKLCKKFDVKVLIISLAKTKFELRSTNDLMAFGRTLGIEKEMWLTKKIKKK